VIEVTKKHSKRLRQGDIVRNIECIEYAIEKQGIITVSKIEYPLIIVLTQDCDLEQDYKFRNEAKGSDDKILFYVLVAPLYNADHVYNGEHLSLLNLEMEKINKTKTRGQNIRINQNPRYHYMEFSKDLGLLPSIIDFKHFFSVNAEYLKLHKRSNFICSVKPLYREDISFRFASYLARIGLPEPKEQQKTSILSQVL